MSDLAAGHRKLPMHSARHMTGNRNVVRLVAQDQPHLAIRHENSLGKDAPCTRAIERLGDIVAHPILGGLHHRYARVADATGGSAIRRRFTERSGPVTSPEPEFKKVRTAPTGAGVCVPPGLFVTSTGGARSSKKKFEFFKANNIILPPSTSALHSLQSDRSPACRRRDCRRLRRRSPEMPAGAERRAA